MKEDFESLEEFIIDVGVNMASIVFFVEAGWGRAGEVKAMF